MTEAARQLLEDCGVDQERLALEWASAAEAPRFVELITGYVSRIREKGPLGTADGEIPAGDMKRRLSAAVRAAEARKPRTMLGNLAKKLAKSGDYSKEAISQGVRQKVLPAMRAERISIEARMILEEGPAGIKALCTKTGASKEELEKVMAPLEKKGIVSRKKTKFSLAGGK